MAQGDVWSGGAYPTCGLFGMALLHDFTLGITNTQAETLVTVFSEQLVLFPAIKESEIPVTSTPFGHGGPSPVPGVTYYEGTLLAGITESANAQSGPLALDNFSTHSYSGATYPIPLAWEITYSYVRGGSEADSITYSASAVANLGGQLGPVSAGGPHPFPDTGNGYYIFTFAPCGGLGIRIWDGSKWICEPLSIENTAWANAEAIYAWDGSKWIDCGCAPS